MSVLKYNVYEYFLSYYFKNLDFKTKIKKVLCTNGIYNIILTVDEIFEEIKNKNLLYNIHKFKYKNIRCWLKYKKHENNCLYLYCYININLNRIFDIERLKLPNKITYNDGFWIGFYINNVDDLNIEDIIFDDEKYIHSDIFKLPSFAKKICMNVINNYIHILNF